MKILVIDDDRIVCETLTRILETKGFEVLAAGDGLCGMAMFREAKPGLVITDMLMPHQEGIETIRQMRGQRPTVKIIAMSGDSPDGDFNMLSIARQLGADEAIGKPVNASALLDLIARVGCSQ